MINKKTTSIMGVMLAPTPVRLRVEGSCIESSYRTPG